MSDGENPEQALAPKPVPQPTSEPVAPAQAVPAPMPQAAPPAEPAPKLNALVVDDEPANCDFLVRLLQQANMNVGGAYTGADALELADSQVRFLRRAPLPDALAARVARVGQWIERIFAATLPGGHFLVVPGLPRPEWLGGGSAALTDDEIIALLRRPPASGWPRCARLR